MSDSLKLPLPPRHPPQLRYVILHHTGISEPHYDLMFETEPGSLLVTWRSPVWPIGQPTPLIKLAEHRREYLVYEGSVSGNRGQVMQIASGFYRLENRSPDIWRLVFRDYIGFTQLEFRANSTTIDGEIRESWIARPIA